MAYGFRVEVSLEFRLSLWGCRVQGLGFMVESFILRLGLWAFSDVPFPFFGLEVL